MFLISVKEPCVTRSKSASQTSHGSTLSTIPQPSVNDAILPVPQSVDNHHNKASRDSPTVHFFVVAIFILGHLVDASLPIFR